MEHCNCCNRDYKNIKLHYKSKKHISNELLKNDDNVRINQDYLLQFAHNAYVQTLMQNKSQNIDNV